MEHNSDYLSLTEEEESIGKAVVNAAYIVHKELGPGLLEKVYEACFCHVLANHGYFVQRQIELPILFQGIKIDEGLKLDVLINDCVICELKAVDQINPVWKAQIISHLKLTGNRLGYLINFNVPLIKDGIKRFII